MIESNDQPARGVRLFARAVWARAYPRVIGQQRQRIWLVFEIAIPVMTTVGYGLVYRALDAPDDYVRFAVIAGAMSAFWLNALWSLIGLLYFERDTGHLALFVMSPSPLIAIMLGMAAGGMAAAALRATMIGIVGSWLFGVSFPVHRWGLLAATIVIGVSALYALGMAAASLFLRFGRSAWNVANSFQEPVYLISGFYFPVRQLGPVAASVASVAPMTLTLDAIRQVVTTAGQSQAFLPLRVELAILLLLLALASIASIVTVEKMERLAITSGRLIHRHQ